MLQSGSSKTWHFTRKIYRHSPMLELNFIDLGMKITLQDMLVDKKTKDIREIPRGTLNANCDNIAKYDDTNFVKVYML
jgi:hypothetical protein